MDANSLMKLPNVELGVKIVKLLNGKEVTSYRIHNTLVSTIAPLAIAKPHWRFVVNQAYDAGSVLEISEFIIKEDSEVLGDVSIERMRSGDRCVAISNHRIKDKLERGHARRTTKPEKAITLIKKTFGKRNVSELVESAKSRSRGAIGSILWSKSRNAEEKFSALVPHLLSFAMDAEHNHMFNAYVQRMTNSTDVIDRLTHAKTEHEVVKRINELHDRGETYLTLLDGDRYIVAKGNEIQTYTADTLPDWMRGKVGIMKLSTNGQVVDNCGMRVDENTFFIVFE